MREVLDQVMMNYNMFEIHLVTMMKQKQNHEEQSNEDHKTRNEGGGSETTTMVMKPFMDLGLVAPPALEIDVISQLLFDEHSRSPPLHTNSNIDQREESPDQQVIRAGNSNKVPRLSSSKNNNTTNIDQATEATIRKARVSVRARSEAPMVYNC